MGHQECDAIRAAIAHDRPARCGVPVGGGALLSGERCIVHRYPCRILLSVCDPQEAISAHGADISGFQPTVIIHYAFGFFFLVPVSHHHAGCFDEDLTIICDPNPYVVQGRPTDPN